GGQVDTAFGGPGSSFGPAGTVTTNLGPGDDQATTVALMGTGKLIVGGFSQQNNNSTSGINKDFALVRYDANGHLDTNFGNHGQVTEDVEAADDLLNALIVQPDDRIVVTGNFSGAGSVDKTIQRFNTDGSLDTTFNVAQATGRIFASFGSGD